ncbi:MAG: hypothetical protein WCJ02_01145 [bacterium]
MNEQEPKKQIGWTIASLVVLILDVIGVLVLATITLFVKSIFLELFKDLDVPLPQITQFFLSIPATFYLIIFSGLILALILKENAIKNKPLAFVANMVALVIGIAYCLLYLTAMYLPLIQIIQSM